MVKRRARILAALGALLLVVAVALTWLVGTRGGAVAALELARRMTGLEMRAELEGSLWSGLALRDFYLAWPGGRLSGDRLDFSWHPPALARGELQIDEMAAGRLQLALAADKAETGPAPAKTDQPMPLLPDWLVALRVAPADIRFESFTLTEGERPVLELRTFSGQISSGDGTASLERIQVGLPCGRWQGDITADLATREVRGDLVWQGTSFFRDWDTVQTRVALTPDGQGQLDATLLAGAAPRLLLASPFRLSAAGLQLTELDLRRPAGPDRITGTVTVAWQEDFRLAADLTLADLDLKPEAGQATRLSGTVRGDLDTAGFRAQIDLHNRQPGWRAAVIAAQIDGTWDGLVIDQFSGRWLDGQLTGRLALDWQQGIHLSGGLAGTGLDPAHIDSRVQGSLTFEASGDLRLGDDGLTADWDADFTRSRLRDRPFAGRLSGSWDRGVLHLATIDLAGDGLRLTGRGQLPGRLDVALAVSDLGRLLQGGAGGATLDGWVNFNGEDWSGAVRGHLNGLALADYGARSGEIDIDWPGKGAKGRLQLSIEGLAWPGGELASARLDASGSPDDHKLALHLQHPGVVLSATLAGGLTGESWHGTLEQLQTQAATGVWQLRQPSALTVGRRALAVDTLLLTDDTGGQLALDGNFNWTGDVPVGKLVASWTRLPLSHLDPLVAPWSLEGTADGELALDLGENRESSLTGRLESAPTLVWHGGRVGFATTSLAIDWNGTGLEVEGRLAPDAGGLARIRLHSAAPPGLSFPDNGRIDGRLNAIPLALVQPWLPEAVQGTGTIRGELNGAWDKTGLNALACALQIDNGELRWLTGDGVVTLKLANARADCALNDRTLIGGLDIGLAGSGSVRGRFRLPAPPTRGPIDAHLDIDLQELGLIALLLPSSIEESRGRIQGRLSVSGLLDSPAYTGEISLSGAGATLPDLGLQLTDISARGLLEGRRFRLVDFGLNSGAGRLSGAGEVSLESFPPVDWHAQLSGKDVLLVNLPELRAIATPDLQVLGSRDRILVRGRIPFSELRISEPERKQVVRASDDVIVLGREDRSEPVAATGVLLQLDLELGQHAVIKARGLDARLEGSVHLANNQQGMITGQGDIRVAQGAYSAYGIKLPITRGLVTFGGGPVDNPQLDVLAQKTFGEVKAGLTVTGTPRKPVVALVSDPPLPDTDILSYLVLGRPLDATQGESNALMLAAGVLLSQAESAALQERLSRRLGIDTLEVQSTDGNVETSVIAVGKYLTPDLYISYGRGLFTPVGVAQLRYRISDSWELESQFGQTSGVDLTYRLEFD
ncbi:MAG: hypothetical protein Tsb0017_20560 [Geothermobacteraceae bacterium]